MKSILCTECNKQINKKKDLAIAGKLMQPYHIGCLNKPNSNLGKLHKFIGRFPMGARFWILIIFGNIFIGEVFRRGPESISAIIFFSAVFNIVFIGARIGIYYSYEKYLE